MRVTIVSLLMTFVVWSASGAGSLELTGKIDAVTVYRGQALVTRLVDVPGPAGLREVTVTGLPEQILPGSIHAETADGLSVRSVRYRVRPMQEDVRDEVRALDVQIREKNDLLRTNQRFTEELVQRKAYLEKLETFTAVTADVELTRGVLNAGTVRELTEFLFNAREELANGQLELEREAQALTAQRDLLQRKRNELSGGSNRVAREAVIFVDLPTDTGGTLRLRYLVNSATWSPSYNVRRITDQDGLLVEYNAAIQQMSGEDWTDVVTTLSTATPSLVSKAPVLEPMRIKLGHPQDQQQARASKGYNTARLELQQQKLQVDNLRVQKGGSVQQDMQQSETAQASPARQWAGSPQLDLELNRVANDMQILDLVSASRSQLREALATPTDEGISVSYSLASRTTLPSRSDRQLVQIAALPVAAEFYKVATPVLTNYVYDEARVTNNTSYVLLAGPVSTYLDGHFVGHGDVPTVAVGQSFTVGLGIDSSLRVARALIDTTQQIQGGNRIAEFKYELSLENFGDTPADVRLLDRLPGTRHTDIKLTLVSEGPGLSKDHDYRETDRKKGILRWDLEVPKAAIGTGAKKLTYSFRLEYDKQMSIVGLPVAAN